MTEDTLCNCNVFYIIFDPCEIIVVYEHFEDLVRIIWDFANFKLQIIWIFKV